ncbi:MAG: DUF853 domain-containing protein [Motiliproteus sp.]|nr:DUF853 domain-containing protein [Motiliproteus sp.]MCW9052098.1 DUF853 domain-containing protein [Motiliproteus sp.]
MGLTMNIGATAEQQIIALNLSMANRHGLIAGATGTGKTVTLQTLAEGFSSAGVPVFMADVKGDLSGLAIAGSPHPKITERIEQIAVEGYHHRANPTVFWDLYGKQGHPVRATISDMGPLLLANLMDLNETQTGVLYACFRIADDQGLLMLDLKDLRSMLSWAGENSKALSKEYGNISTASVGAIQRRLLVLEQEGAELFFGEPALELKDLMQVDFSGNGVISVLDATALMPKPQLYSTFLLWLLSELFEQLPEQGDSDKPKLVFFFDEAHLLFDSAPKVLIDKIEQVVRLIRSKGVGIYFISQSPSDIPDDILGQLGNRVQHALRAFTPKDQKAVRVAAQTFRAKPGLDTEKTITELGVGEALVSVLDGDGIPTPVERTLICPPASRLGPLTEQERSERLQRSPLASKYDQAIDRESAYEVLNKRIEEAAKQAEAAELEAERQAAERKAAPKPKSKRGRQSDSMLEAAAKSTLRAVGSQLGRQLVRGILGSLFGGRR